MGIAELSEAGVGIDLRGDPGVFAPAEPEPFNFSDRLVSLSRVVYRSSLRPKSLLFQGAEVMKNRTFQEGQKESRWLSWFALICLMAGWLVAVLIGGGLELHRSAVAVPLVGLAAFLGLTDAIRSGRAISLPLLIGGGACVFVFRGQSVLLRCLGPWSP